MTTEKSPQIVTIDNVEYNANNFSTNQLLFFNHCIDLDRKIASTTFQLQQLQVGKDSFFRLLKAELVKTPEVE